MSTIIKFNTLKAMHKRMWEIIPTASNLNDVNELFNRSSLALHTAYNSLQDGLAYFYELYNVRCYSTNMDHCWARILNSLIGEYLFDAIKKSAMNHGMWNEFKDAFCRKHHIKYSNYLMRDVFKKHYNHLDPYNIQYRMEQLIIWDPILSKKYDQTPNIVWDDDGPFRLWKRDFIALLDEIKVE